MRRQIKLIFSATLAVLVMSLNLRAAIADDGIDQALNKLKNEERCFWLTQGNIDYLRNLSIRWDPMMENGAAVVEATGVLNRLTGLFRSESSQRDIEYAFQIFLAFGTLKPGVYNLKSDVVSDYRDGIKDEWRLAKIDKFEFTESHLKLLNHARGEWNDFYDALAIDPKRPYGDMTNFELDMADILGIRIEMDPEGNPKIEPAQQKQFDSLFQNLPFSLAVFLENASIKAGEFCRKPADWGEWQRKSEWPEPRSRYKSTRDE